MEKNEEMVIMKSDLAIAVKKDGTFIINNPQLETYVNLYKGIAAHLATAEKVDMAKFCIGEMLGRPAIEKVISDEIKKIEKRGKWEEEKK